MENVNLDEDAIDLPSFTDESVEIDDAYKAEDNLTEIIDDIGNVESNLKELELEIPSAPTPQASEHTTEHTSTAELELDHDIPTPEMDVPAEQTIEHTSTAELELDHDIPTPEMDVPAEQTIEHTSTAELELDDDIPTSDMDVAAEQTTEHTSTTELELDDNIPTSDLEMDVAAEQTTEHTPTAELELDDDIPTSDMDVPAEQTIEHTSTAELELDHDIPTSDLEMETNDVNETNEINADTSPAPPEPLPLDANDPLIEEDHLKEDDEIVSLSHYEMDNILVDVKETEATEGPMSDSISASMSEPISLDSSAADNSIDSHDAPKDISTIEKNIDDYIKLLPIDKEELVSLIKKIDSMLGFLPKEKIKEFAHSQHYDKYILLINKLSSIQKIK